MSVDRQIMEGLFNTLANSTERPVAWPGVEFANKPAEGSAGIWLEVAVFPNTPQREELANASARDYNGFMQVAVKYWSGGGILDGADEVATVQAAFPKGSQHGPATITRHPYSSDVVIDGREIGHPVTINYRAFA